MLEGLTRRQIRYDCYRLRTEAQGGEEAGIAQEFRAFFESQYWFMGWENFASTWDLSEDGREAVPRKFSEEAEWNSRLAEIAVDL